MAVQVDKLDVNIKGLTDSVIKNLFKLGALQETSDKGGKHSVESQCNVSVRMDTSLASLNDVSCDVIKLMPISFCFRVIR